MLATLYLEELNLAQLIAGLSWDLILLAFCAFGFYFRRSQIKQSRLVLGRYVLTATFLITAGVFLALELLARIARVA